MRSPRWLLGVVLIASIVTCAAQTKPGAGGKRDSNVLADSELRYIESGGLAGRTREAQLTADGGRVTARYRGEETRGSREPLVGNVDDVTPYEALWRDVDRMDLWSVESARKSAGADLIQYELHLRRGQQSHVIRWDDGTASPPREAAALGQRILALAREATMYR